MPQEPWPELVLEEWRATRDTLHMWMQVVGKIRLFRSDSENHYWHVALYVTPRGLTTAVIPDGARTFSIEFDFLEHSLSIITSDGMVAGFPLEPMAVADFYARLMEALGRLGIEVRITTFPVETDITEKFDEDRVHASYDPDAVSRVHRILVQVDRVLRRFRGEFMGKQSPVHFFWGAFDLALTRFSGRRAPEKPDADSVTRESYSHEVHSVGWWPGSGEMTEAAFYAYAAPPPEGFATARVEPAAARWSDTLGEFVLPYEAVRTADDPEEAILAFCRSTWNAAARLGGWDRTALERRPR